MGLNIAFFGSSLLSACWNGAATYYRGIIKALAGRGHRITFYEPDAFGRQQHRDIEAPSWAEVVVYRGEEQARQWVETASRADLVIKASGVGAFDELLERAVLERRRRPGRVAFWDVDAPATLARIAANPTDPFRELIPQYDIVFTYGGGSAVVNAYLALGARHCVPIYNAVDPATHYPVPPDSRFTGDLCFLANRLPDRERRADEFFFEVAQQLPRHRFLLGGSGWQDKPRAENIQYVGHVYTYDHNAFNCSSRAVLNVNRDSMAEVGFSPATRVFEAAGAGACLITDAWQGLEHFFEPGRELLVATDGQEVAEHLAKLTSSRAHDIGQAALRRVLESHTYEQRARDVEFALGEIPSAGVKMGLAS